MVMAACTMHMLMLYFFAAGGTHSGDGGFEEDTFTCPGVVAIYYRLAFFDIGDGV